MPWERPGRPGDVLEAHVRTRITKRLVGSLKPTESDYYAFDIDTIGFGVRVRATGGMSYIVQ
jgi:hypothetical protein